MTVQQIRMTSRVAISSLHAAKRNSLMCWRRQQASDRASDLPPISSGAAAVVRAWSKRDDVVQRRAVLQVAKAISIRSD